MGIGAVTGLNVAAWQREDDVAAGFVEPDRAIGSIKVGQRHRREMGDLDELAASIAEYGMLQPITIAPGGFLICGARRLAAAKQLGWKQIRVWVHTAISTELELLLAEQQENMVRKPLTPTEEASLYAELKELLAEDARRRQQATRYRSDGSAGVVPPVPAGPDGDARVQAALEVTGRRSYTRLEQVRAIEKLANSHRQPAEIRQMAREQLRAIDADGTVEGHYLAVKSSTLLAELRGVAADDNQPSAIRQYAHEQYHRLTDAAGSTPRAKVVSMTKSALARCRQGQLPGGAPAEVSERARSRRADRDAIQTVLHWIANAADDALMTDPAVATRMSGPQWKEFHDAANTLADFIDQARTARERDRTGTPAA